MSLSKWMVCSIGLLAAGTARAGETASAAALARDARLVLEKHCFRCHGQDGANKGGLNYVLDAGQLIKNKLVIPGDPESSELLQRVLDANMPPKKEQPRPDAAERTMLVKWIKAGAPALLAKTNREFITLKETLYAIRNHLDRVRERDQPFMRYFTLTNLHNLSTVKDEELPLAAAGLSKLINSLSWQNTIAVPQAVDAAKAVLAVDVRDYGWDAAVWDDVLLEYPYGLKHDQYPDDSDSRRAAADIYRLTKSDQPYLRADWFIAAASRPPLYHRLLGIPPTAPELEKKLGVVAIRNFDATQRLVRAGFAESKVSNQNRLVERYPSSFGGYWKSYDFKPEGADNKKRNLFKFPLGPNFPDHPFPKFAFEHDGGELIFSLPNRLQGYMLVDEKENRIDEGPIEVVQDSQNTSGDPKIVNGLSCMACHRHGMISALTDTLVNGTRLPVPELDVLRELHQEQQIRKHLAEDERSFLTALATAYEGIVSINNIKSVPESVGPIAREYRFQLGSEKIAAELGVADAKLLRSKIESNQPLIDLGLGPVASGHTIDRKSWEALHNFTSVYQETARILKLGVPKRYHE